MKAQHEFKTIIEHQEYLRTYFAAMAMQAILTNYSPQTIYQIEPGKKAVKYADALIAALNEIEP